MPSVIVLGGSAGGLQSLLLVLADLPRWLPASIVVALHLPSRSLLTSELPRVLQARTRLPVQWAQHGQRLMRRCVYVAPAATCTALDPDGVFRVLPLSRGPQPSINVLFGSIAQACGARGIGVVLSGCLSDGARGAWEIAAAGGTVVVEDPRTALHREMPDAALATGVGAWVLPAERIAGALAMRLLATGSGAWFRVRPSSPYVATVA